MLLFGGKSRTKQVPGGRQERRRCDECKSEQTFIECEIADRLDLFFVPILQGKSRRLVCVECGEDVELDVARPVVPRAAPPARRSMSEAEKDDLLAALKKKMRV